MAREEKWRGIYSLLRARALQMEPGESLGRTVRQLAEDFGVNFKTVLKAVSLLKNEGVLYAHSGIGLRVHPECDGTQFEKYLLYLSRNIQGTGFDEIMQDVIRVRAEEVGYNFRAIRCSEYHTAAALIRSGIVSGAFLSFYSPRAEVRKAAERLLASHIPVVAVDQKYPGCDSVVMDNVQIGRMVGRLLASHHENRRILICMRHTYAEPEFEREEGMREVFSEMNVPHHRVLWSTSRMAIPLLRSYLEAGIVVDAVYSHLKSFFHSVRELYSEYNLPYPMQVVPGMSHELPPEGGSLAGVSAEAMANSAFDLLLQRIQNPDRPATIKTVPCVMKYSSS